MKTIFSHIAEALSLLWRRYQARRTHRELLAAFERSASDRADWARWGRTK